MSRISLLALALAGPCSLALSLLVAPSLARAEASQAPGPASGPLEPAAEPIIGGTAVPAGKWPDAVAVIGAQGSCTGTLIAPDVVLTAGHCVDAGPRRVVANTLDYAAAGGVSANVLRTTAYPSWETSYDVAVIVLATPITGVTPRKVGTACTFQQSFGRDKQVHLVGFGSTDIQGGGSNSRLNETTVSVTDPDCTTGNGCVAAISPGGEFIAGGNGKDTCFGDSGGPVYLDTPRGPVVVGAVSRGLATSTNPCGDGGIYVRTDKIVAWIESTSGKQIAKDTCEVAPAGGEQTPTGNPGEEPRTGGADPDAPTDVVGGCSSARGGVGGGVSAGALALLGVLGARRRRSRAPRAARLTHGSRGAGGPGSSALRG